MLRSFHTALSRSNQCVEPQAPPSTRGAHHSKPKSSATDAMPESSVTSPWAMKSIETDRGGPIIPVSNPRATSRSPVDDGSSRWPMPGGSMHVVVSSS